MDARRGPRRAFPVLFALVLGAGAACAPHSTAQPAAQASADAATAPAPVRTVAARVLARFPHDPGAFTQGLLIRDGRMYESLGDYDHSRVREVDLKSGRVLREVPLPAGQFGEGMAAVGDELVSLTWQDGVAHRWRRSDFAPRGQFTYPGEGWGLTGDGRTLILSDGTPVLRFMDPATFREVRRVSVTADGVAIGQLNELEWVDGEVLANVWHQDRIARIDPATGRVKGWIDLSAIVRDTPRRESEAVLNGIAWDPQARRLYVTGKHWPALYRIAWPVG